MDGKYFCLVGLCRNHLTMGIITHESVHVGYNFAARKLKGAWDRVADHFGEEHIAYPAGQFASGLVYWLRRKELIE